MKSHELRRDKVVRVKIRIGNCGKSNRWRRTISEFRNAEFCTTRYRKFSIGCKFWIKLLSCTSYFADVNENMTSYGNQN